MEQLQVNSMQSSKMTMPPKIVAQDESMHEDESLNEIRPTDSASTEPTATLLADSLEQGKALLNEHKGKLAIGVAATLGLMVFYKWREKKLAEEDPEEYARLQRLKAVVREQEANGENAGRYADDED